MIIDANVYLGSWPYWRMETKRAAALSDVMKSNGINKALVGSLRSVFYHAEDGNQEILDACKKYPGSIYGLATLTPLSDPKGIGYRGLRAGAFKGIKIYPQYHGFSISHGDGVYELAEDLRVPVVIAYRLTMSWSLPAISIEDVLAVAREHPKVNFVLSGFNYDIMGVLLARLFPPNLYVETSGFQIEGGVELLVKTLGTDHVLLGTGLPLQFAQTGLQKVLKSKLGKDQLDAVKSRNVVSLFRMKG